MKKVLLLTALLIGLFASAQRTAVASIEKAKPFLVNDPCNYNGISWVEGALLLDPNNQEAKRLIKQCTNIKVQNAKDLLNKKIGDSKGREDLGDLMTKDSDYLTEENNYLMAKSYLSFGAYRTAIEYIDKVIEFNPNNIDYRWVRVRCNMIMDAPIEQFKQACFDLNFMIQSGANSSKVYSTLGKAEYELGNAILRWTHINKNEGYSDDNRSEKAQRKSIIEQTILHYGNSKNSYLKAIEISKKEGSDESYEIKKIDKEIPDLQEQLKKLS